LKPFVTVILAAGKGKRMGNPEFPKVLFELNGRPLIDYVVRLALRLESKKTIIVVGHQRDIVVRHVSREFGRRVSYVVQRKQLGTGHAVLQTEGKINHLAGDVLVLSGDVPLLKEETLRTLLFTHQKSEAAATILTAETDNPAGYGRILRYPDGSVQKIIEHGDATEAQRKVKEINSGIYVFKKAELFKALKELSPANVQKEYYLTGVFEIFSKEGSPIVAVKTIDFNEVHGVNTSEELKEAREIQIHQEASGSGTDKAVGRR
jgi:bifunctional UDP-N-acetylglucosamine pyrophosphorylase/glucosamine-1-phosphate N-acetyltransferase